MKFKQRSKIREKFINIVQRIVNCLDNVGNPDFLLNGESNFIKEISEHYKDKMVFFDIGANIGDYTGFLMKERNGKKSDDYHLFEPQKSCFEELRIKYQNNVNVILNNMGLSDTRAEAVIYKNADKSGLTSLYKRNLEFYNFKMDIEENISLDTAENYINKKNILKINLIKLDVEGNEIKTLNGFGSYLNNKFIDFIQFEYGGANIDSRTNLMDFYTLLEPKGFKICKIMKKSLEYRRYDPRFENFVNQNYVAVSDYIFNL